MFMDQDIVSEVHVYTLHHVHVKKTLVRPMSCYLDRTSLAKSGLILLLQYIYMANNKVSWQIIVGNHGFHVGKMRPILP